MTDLGNPDFERELYFLVAKFLENGPCKEAAKVLRRELEDNKLVIPRKDWQGGTHERTIKEYDGLNNHVCPDHLARIASSINPLLQKCHPTSVKSINSLLSRGAFSVLRTDLPTISDCSQTTARHAATSHCAARIHQSRKNKHLSIVPIFNGSSLVGVRGNSNIVNNCIVYSKLCMHKRVLGHLASVYCVLFDRTGSIIATGADDNLLKLWSSSDGRLVATLRGHAGQITDIDINRENTLIAAGSLDKTIRVWKLQDTHPVAVLQGHTGMITSLRFCPYPDDNVRYLMSTGGDGHVCFWSWDPKTTEFSLTPIKFNEKSRPGAQMLCSSFSPGGSFLVTGSSDNYIRVYSLYPDSPEKVAELPNHGDHVDSILYSHAGDRFLSGSRDGTAVIWYYKHGDWQAKCLDASKLLAEEHGRAHLESNEKLKVTMICWNKNDFYVVTAGTDCLLRVWNSHTGTLVHALKGHTDEVYGLEAHPIEPSLLLSAGHDGNMIIWNIYSGERIKTFFNMLEGQGHGAIFDCKFSPYGHMFSATDSHGHLLIFGFGSNERYNKVPNEQFFHSDYRPIIRDTNNYVLDEQNQLAPHLMPPPFLVDIDGNPYESQYQLLIPGRNASNLPQLRVEEPLATDNMPPLMAEIAAAEAEQNLLTVPGTRNRTRSNEEGAAPAPFSPGGTGGGVGLRESGDVEGVRQQNLYTSGDINDADAEAWRNRTIIRANNIYNQKEDEVNRLKQGMDERAHYLKELSKRKRRPSEGSHDLNDDLTTRAARGGRGRGRGTRGRGRGGRQAKVRQNTTYVRPEALNMLPYLHSAPRGQVVNLDGTIHQSSDSELDDWQGESSTTTDEEWQESKKLELKKESTRRRTKKRVPSMEYSFDEDDEEEENKPTSSRRRVKKRVVEDDDDDDEEKLDVDVDGSETDPAEGSEDEAMNTSDIPSIKVEDTKGRRVKRKDVVADDAGDEESPDNSSSDEESSTASSVHSEGEDVVPKKRKARRKRSTGKQKAEKKKVTKRNYVRKPKQKIKSVMPVPPVNDLEAYLQFYHPPEWLLSLEPRKFPYFPQINDEVFYFRQGHELYGIEVQRQNVYDFCEMKQAYRRKDLEPVELCKLIGVTYDVGPPKICSLKLELLSKPKRSSGGMRTITIRFHDMPGVADFLVLKHIYENSMNDSWGEGDRFRCIIDDSWYVGTIVEVSPYQETFLTSPFLSLVVKWDSGDDERLSPWDLEKIPQGQNITDNTPVSKKDKLIYQYTPDETDWPNEPKEKLMKRVAKGLRDITALDVAAPFACPVNVRNYPTYWSAIAMPTDLETIRKRLENSFYRRIDALLWEVRQIVHNTLKFNETTSGIVSDSKLVVRLLCKFIKDPVIKNIITLYRELDEQVEIKGESSQNGQTSGDEEHNGSEEEIEVEEEEEEEVEEEEEEEESDGEEDEEEDEVPSTERRSWQEEANSLLEFIYNKDDAVPFRTPVNINEFPDYLEHVLHPIDISVIRQRLESNEYATADTFINDFRTVFKNSKNYNTDRRSLIYKMTLRLSALFESRVETVTQAYAFSVANDVHLTRAQTRNRRRALGAEVPPIEVTHRTRRKVKRNVQQNNSSESEPEPSPCKEESKNTPEKNNVVTLNEFVTRPITRSRRPARRGSNNHDNGEEETDDNVGSSNLMFTKTRNSDTSDLSNTETSRPARRPRRVVVNNENGVGCSKDLSEKSNSEASNSSDSEKSNCSDGDNRKSSISSYEDLYNKQSTSKRPVSNRIFKRCRYNNDSDPGADKKRVRVNEDGFDDIANHEESNTISPRKSNRVSSSPRKFHNSPSTKFNNRTLSPRKTGRSRGGGSRGATRGRRRNGNSRKTSRGSMSQSRTSRNRTTVNYCEDEEDFDPYDIVMEDERNRNVSDYTTLFTHVNNVSNRNEMSDNDSDQNSVKSENESDNNSDDSNKSDKNSDNSSGGSEEEEEVEEEEVEGTVESEGGGSSSDDSVVSSTSSHDEIPSSTVFPTVSSRGRIRKAASRFTDFVDK